MDNDGSGPLEGMDFTPPPAHTQHNGRDRAGKKRWLVIGLITLVVITVAVGVALLLTHKKKPADKTQDAAQQTTASSSSASSANSTSASGSNTAGGTYKSTTLNLSFTYPAGWTAKESADKAEVIVTSPSTSYTKKDGTAAQGVFTVKMRHGTIPEGIQQTTTKAVATAASLIIAYDKPTANQRQYTNVSYGGADASTFNFFIVSGNAALKAGQAMGYNVDLTGSDAYMFAGGYGADANDTLSFDPIATTSYDTPTFEAAMGIIKSLQIN